MNLLLLIGISALADRPTAYERSASATEAGQQSELYRVDTPVLVILLNYLIALVYLVIDRLMKLLIQLERPRAALNGIYTYIYTELW